MTEVLQIKSKDLTPILLLPARVARVVAVHGKSGDEDRAVDAATGPPRAVCARETGRRARLQDGYVDVKSHTS